MTWFTVVWIIMFLWQAVYKIEVRGGTNMNVLHLGSCLCRYMLGQPPTLLPLVYCTVWQGLFIAEDTISPNLL
jgi:hypothetical protein